MTPAPLGLSSGSDVEQAGLGYHRQELLSPHNQYLLVLAEQGALGALAFTSMLLVLTAAAVAATRRAPPGWRGLGYGAVGLIVLQGVDFVYGDLGGLSSLTTSVVLGLTAWWGMEQPARPSLRP